MKLYYRLLLAAVFTAAVLSGCANNAPAPTEATAPAVTAAPTEPSTVPEEPTESHILQPVGGFSQIPETLCLSVGQTSHYDIQSGVLQVSDGSADGLVCQSLGVFPWTAAAAEHPASKIEDGHYYHIYNRLYGKFVSSGSSEDGMGIRLIPDVSSGYTIWKATETADGILLESDRGFLTLGADNRLLCSAEGSRFLLEESHAENSSGSFGVFASFALNRYRLDCFTDEKLACYSDDGTIYPHTSFYFFEVTDAPAYTSVDITATQPGDYTLTIDGKTHDVHVYHPKDLAVDLLGNDVTVSGYNLPDSEVHDCGFFTYTCNPEKNEITFTATGEGKGVFRIGELEYAVNTGGTEVQYQDCTYQSLNGALLDACENAKESRFRPQIISFLSENVLFNGTIPAGVLLHMNGHFGMEDEILLSYTIKSESVSDPVEYTIFPRRQEDVEYLYLPSFADFAALNLHLPQGVVISADGFDRTVTVPANNAPIDLTQIFGDMSAAGAVFPIQITWKTDKMHLQQQLTLVKSANIHSLFFQVEQEGIEDMVEWFSAKRFHRVSGGNVLLLSSDGKVCYDGTLKDFHMRGKSNVEQGTALLKSSYALKLPKKQALIGELKSKSWCLVANGVDGRDNTTFGTAVGETLYQQMNMDSGDDYAVQYLPVDVYVNEEYRGTFMLTDKVNDDRIPIKNSKYSVKDKNYYERIKDPADPVIGAGLRQYSYARDAVLEENGNGGFVIEICGFETGVCGFITRRGIPVEIKEPDCATKEQVQQIACYFQEFEDALYSEDGYNSAGKHYTEYIDSGSWAKYYVIKSFLQDMDFFWGSAYMYIDGDDTGFTTKLKCCTAWDFDGCAVFYGDYTSELFDTRLAGAQSGADYKWQFLEHPDFVEVLRKYSTEKVYEGGTRNFADLVEELCQPGSFLDTYYAQMDNAMSMNKQLWTYCTWKNQGETAEFMRQRLITRLQYWTELWSNPDGLAPVPGRVH